MVIGIFGECCTGKSVIAEELSRRTGAEIYAGKDYLKLAKNEAEAKKRFSDLLASNAETGEYIIYVISERELLQLLPEKALRVLMTVDFGVIKERFSRRMNAPLPPPVAAMLERKHGMFDGERHDLRVESIEDRVTEVCDRIMELFRE